MTDISKHHDYELSRLDIDTVEKSIHELRELITIADATKIREEYKKDPNTWWAAYHHGWGTAIRNHLRDKVCLDDQLPSGNWDDYYIRLVEKACGI